MGRVVTDKQTHINDNSIACKVNTIVYNAEYMSKEHEPYTFTMKITLQSILINNNEQSISITEQDYFKC